MTPAGKLLTAFGLGSAGALLYGGVVEANRLKGVRQTLVLPSWPEHLNGFTIGVFSDTHMSHPRHRDMTREGVEWLVEQNPRVIVCLGDIQNYHKPEVDHWIEEALTPIKEWGGEALAIFGNHDYFGGEPDRLVDDFAGLGIKVLRNQLYRTLGIDWVGVDSACVGRADPFTPLLQTSGDQPIVVLWHEPDMVDELPRGPELMLSGHSHGGQFTFPGGWAPMTSRLGSKYLAGFYPDTNAPLYVTRGVAVTGPPSRLFCAPEVNLLTLYGA